MVNFKERYIFKDNFLENILRFNGVKDINNFLYITKDFLNDCENLDNIEEAYSLIDNFIGYTKSLIVVDSDADGFLSSSLFTLYFKEAYDFEFDYFLHQHKEHGIEDVEKEIDISKYKLVIIPDAGTNDDEIFKRYPNVNFLVLDHHIRSNEGDIPENVILVNNQTSKNYTNKGLCGTGVTWQFCRYVDKMRKTNFAEKYYDMVATALIGDIMPVTELENRYIIERGFNNYSNPFLFLLKNHNEYKFKDFYSPHKISFYIIPFINAITRSGTMKEKEELFLSLIDPYEKVIGQGRKNKGEIVYRITEMVRQCPNIKKRQDKIKEKMIELCEKQIIENDLDQNKIIIIILDEFFDDIPSEINGLAATEIANKYNRPALIGRINNGKLKGSLRNNSDNGLILDLRKELLKSSLFEWIEGHANAAGFCLPEKNIDKLISWTNSNFSECQLEVYRLVDFCFSPEEDSLKKAIEELDRLKTFWGNGLPKPVFLIKNIPIPCSTITLMGAKQNHLKIIYEGVEYVKFFISEEEYQKIINSDFVAVLGEGVVNFWNNKVKPEIMINEFYYDKI